MNDTAEILKDAHEVLKKFEERKKELYLLKHVAGDLRSYRKMIPFKKYD